MTAPTLDPPVAPAVRHGFTLVELFVVISIIALLIGILLPALAAARSRARAVVCLVNVRQITTAATLYAHDHHAWVGWSPGVDRKMMLYPYLRQGASNADIVGDQVWHCPANALPGEACGYGFNIALNWVPLFAIRTPTRTVALCDAGVLDDGSPRGQPTLTTMASPPSKVAGPAKVYRPNPRHPGRTVTVGFVDGHAEAMPMTPPFYPGPVGQWPGNAVTDPQHPDYQDHLWDLR